MQDKPDEKRLEEIQEVYRSMGLESEEVRKYLASLPSSLGETEQERPIIFIEAGTTSYSQGEFKYARLESTPE
jgi:hypothetical protein